MIIITYSLVVATLLFNLALAVVTILQRRTWYLAKFGTLSLVVLMLFGAIRLFLPLSFPQVTITINSTNLLPGLVNLFRAELWAGIELQTVLFVLWAVGAAIVLFRLMRTMRRFSILRFLCKIKASDNSRAVRIAQKLGLKRAEIVVSPTVGAPFVTGIYRARIYLPVMDITDDEFELILKHEYQHFKSCDILIKAFYSVLTVVFWWNPFVHIFHRNLDRLLEVRCDDAVKKHLTNTEKSTYLGALYRVMRHAELNDPMNLSANASASTFVMAGEADYEKFVEQRLRLIASSEKPVGMQIISITLAVLIFLGSFLFIIQPFGNPPAEDVTDAHRTSPEVKHIVATADGRYELFANGEFVIELPEIPEIFAQLPIIFEEGYHTHETH